MINKFKKEVVDLKAKKRENRIKYLEKLEKELASLKAAVKELENKTAPEREKRKNHLSLVKN